MAAKKEVESATEEEEAAAENSSGEDFEIRVLIRSTNAPPGGDSDDEAQSASDAEKDSPAEAERAANKCATCSSRRAKACVNQSCKRCCLRMNADCTVHSRVSEPTNVAPEVAAQPLRKARKAVLKNEFKESNVLYYDETVTLFCLRDFFHAKKLSQPLLNDQTRAKRVKAAGNEPPAGEKPKKVSREGSVEAKTRVMDALQEGTKRRKLAAQ